MAQEKLEQLRNAVNELKIGKATRTLGYQRLPLKRQ